MSKGFKVNEYDSCVAHKDIDGHKMIITWRVDDLKVSHMDRFEITKFSSWLSGIYVQDLAFHRGKRHDYVGMDLDYSEPGKVKISTIKYLHRILEGFPELIKRGVTTPAADTCLMCKRKARQNYCLKSKH